MTGFGCRLCDLSGYSAAGADPFMVFFLWLVKITAWLICLAEKLVRITLSEFRTDKATGQIALLKSFRLFPGLKKGLLLWLGFTDTPFSLHGTGTFPGLQSALERKPTFSCSFWMDPLSETFGDCFHEIIELTLLSTSNPPCGLGSDWPLRLAPEPAWMSQFGSGNPDFQYHRGRSRTLKILFFSPNKGWKSKEKVPQRGKN